MWRARATFLCVALLLLARGASAQSAVAGIVTDTTGAVLPGGTIEASSPALIEKARSTSSDASGQYRIVDLRPGTYTITFTLSGFGTVVRQDVRIEANFTAITILNARLIRFGVDLDF
jgi:carboxypeptidase family protein